MRIPHIYVMAPDKRTKISIIDHLTTIGMLSYAMQATQLKIQNIGQKVIKKLYLQHYPTTNNNIAGFTRSKCQQKRKSTHTSVPFYSFRDESYHQKVFDEIVLQQ